MDDHIVFMDNDVVNLAPKIHGYVTELNRAINNIHGVNPHSSVIVRRLEREALFLLNDIQFGITRFQDALERSRLFACKVVHAALMVDWNRLGQIKRSIQSFIAQHLPARMPVQIPVRMPVRVPARISPRIPARVPARVPARTETVRNYSIDEIARRAIESSRIVRQAHMSGPSILRQQRFPIAFDPRHLSNEGLPGMPQSLQNLPGVKGLYYPSFHFQDHVQGGCGTRAIGNALAIRDAEASNSLNPRTVFNNAAQHGDLNSHASTSTDEAIDLALALHLPDLHCLAFMEQYPGTQEIKNNPFPIIASTRYHHEQLNHAVNLYDEDRFQASIVQQIRNSENIVVHFLASVDRVRTNDHFVLISIVKHAGQIPKIIYMDCNNEPIMDQSKDAAFIHYLYLQCIA